MVKKLKLTLFICTTLITTAPISKVLVMKFNESQIFDSCRCPKKCHKINVIKIS